MVGRETRITILILFAFVWVIGTVGNGYGGPPPAGKVLLADRQVSTSEVEIYRGHDRDQDNRLKMIDLCGRLEDDWTRAGANRKTEVEVHRETMKPGVTEYRREVSESNRFAAPADEQKTIELCRRLEDSAGESSKERSESLPRDHRSTLGSKERSGDLPLCSGTRPNNCVAVPPVESGCGPGQHSQ